MKPDFERDTKATFLVEGIYDHDNADPGAETFRGIARAYHPDFIGWITIDEIKSKLTDRSVENIRKALQNHIVLENQAKEFYRARYWNPLRLDEVIDGRIAEELFDQAVNLGLARAGEHLQECLNALNRNGEIYADLVEDGQVGTNTLDALRRYFAADQIYERAVRILLSMLNTKQGAYYFESMRKSPTKEKYARGFFERVRFSKEVA